MIKVAYIDVGNTINLKKKFLIVMETYTPTDEIKFVDIFMNDG